MPRVLLRGNLFEDNNYGIYCLNTSIDHEPSLKKAQKTFKELKESLSKDYEIIIVEVRLVKKR